MTREKWARAGDNQRCAFVSSRTSAAMLQLGASSAVTTLGAAPRETLAGVRFVCISLIVGAPATSVCEHRRRCFSLDVSKFLIMWLKTNRGGRGSSYLSVVEADVVDLGLSCLRGIGMARWWGGSGILRVSTRSPPWSIKRQAWSFQHTQNDQIVLIAHRRFSSARFDGQTSAPLGGR